MKKGGKRKEEEESRTGEEGRVRGNEDGRRERKHERGRGKGK